ncbi:MAG: AGE family epimerase/isomerase [Candidatus Izemoplasmatales bacterium]|nr:AGE family epimerase/isomerase [Candidatus Izemoplasmatales bacterium]
MKEQLEQHLLEKIIPFWTNLIDPEWGGFYGLIDNHHHINPLAPKGLVQQARLLWAFSSLARHYHNDTYRDIAHHQYDYLTSTFRNHEEHNYFWLMDYRGRPIDKRIVTYGQSFMLYALSEYYLLTKDPRVLGKAMGCFEWIEQQAFDSIRMGYIEEFDAFGSPLKNQLLTDGCVNAVFTGNTLIHLLESHLNLYVAEPSQRVKRALERILAIFTDRLYDKDTGQIFMYMDEHYHPVLKKRCYGHEVEVSWLIEEADEALKIDDHLHMSDHIMTTAFKAGWNGRYLLVDEADPEEHHVWWVSSELMIALSKKYAKTHDPHDLEMIRTLYQSIETDLVDPTPGGEWYWSRAKNGEINQERMMGELWKTPYHNVRSLLKVIQRM